MAPRSQDLNPLDFYLWGRLKLLCVQLLLKTEGHFTIALWMSVRLSPTTLVSLSGCGGALNLVEDLLSNYFIYVLFQV
jgi:hypothetical protein